MLNVIDLFCGCGGLSEGFRLAGYNIVGGIDSNESAINTFNHNFEKAKGSCFDLSIMTDEMIEEYLEQLGEIDVIIGGPPCQGFSAANRYKLENEEDDPRNKLFFEFVKFVDFANPKAIVIENVRGIITSNNGYAKDRIYEIFNERGYYVTHKILDASDFGVPQKRHRNFFVITKGVELNLDELEKSEEIVTVKEAIGELYVLEKNAYREEQFLDSSPKTSYQQYLRNTENVIFNHDVRYPAEKVQARIKCVPQGGNWKDIPEEMFENNRTNRHSSAYKRLNEETTSVTIDTGNAHSNYFHPIYHRIPTVREAARLQSFTDRFVFKGSRTDQYRQVGNAVPPLLSKAIAVLLKGELIKNEK